MQEAAHEKASAQTGGEEVGEHCCTPLATQRLACGTQGQHDPCVHGTPGHGAVRQLLSTAHRRSVLMSVQ
jgi:hypothetical protein